METNLFSVLIKYSPQQSKKPVENFLTVAFAWILKNDVNFSKYFLRQIFEDIEFGVNEDIYWETHANFEGFYPDMVCKWKENVFIFEHKTWSNLHENQIAHYRNFAEKKFLNYKIILITAVPAQCQQAPNVHKCWSDIYRYVEEWLKTHEENTFILTCFQELIKHLGMAPTEAVSYASVLYHPICYNLNTNLYDIFDKLLLLYNYKESLNNILPNMNFSIQNSWGRVGICSGNESDWKPGIFIGCLLNGKDHKVQISVVYAVVIISFAATTHKDYPYNFHYKEMVKELKDKVEKRVDGWEFYDHLASEGRCNYWHPIHIRKPLKDLIQGTVTAKEQCDIFANIATDFLNMIKSVSHFDALQKDLENNEYKLKTNNEFEK